MRRTTRDLSETSLLELAETFGIDVDESEVADLLPRVNRRLDDLDEVYELSVTSQEDPGARPWAEPTDDEDPYNAIVTTCNISPTDDGRLSGLDVGLKDIIAVAGVPMQCGSTVMEGFSPSEDATVVSRLRAAGATITAKTNLDEFAGGGRGLAADGRIKHPDDPDRFPAGSSGGSAAAVLSGQVDIALGTDTGGSVRAPAAVCGLVGIKPTYGLVPLTGVIENTYSQDHVGVIAQSIEGAAACLGAIAGKDERDPGSMAAAGHDGYQISDYQSAATNGSSPSSLRLVKLVESFHGGDEAVADQVNTALDELSDAGVEVVEVSLPEFEIVDTIKNCLTYPELAQYWRDGGVPLRRGGGWNPDQLGFARRAEASTGELNAFYRGRLLAGARLLTAHDGRHYNRGLAARDALRDKVNEIFEEQNADAIVSPTVPGIAPKHEDAGDLDFGITRNTRIANVTRQPAMTVPCGTVDDLPVGLHLLGQRFTENKLIQTAAGISPLLGPN